MLGLPGLRPRRKGEGLTQKQLAEMVGVTDAFISQLETEKASASQETLVALSVALTCTTDKLLTPPSYPEAEAGGTVVE